MRFIWSNRLHLLCWLEMLDSHTKKRDALANICAATSSVSRSQLLHDLKTNSQGNHNTNLLSNEFPAGSDPVIVAGEAVS